MGRQKCELAPGLACFNCPYQDCIRGGGGGGSVRGSGRLMRNMCRLRDIVGRRKTPVEREQIK